MSSSELLREACRLAAIVCALSLYSWAMYLVQARFGWLTLWAVASGSGLLVAWCLYLTMTQAEEDPT